MNFSIPDIDQAAADLAAVFDAGLIGELKESIAYARRGLPRNDFEARPGLKYDVEFFGGLLAEWTGLPLQLCKLAALNQLLPGNRHAVALELLTEFADRARGQAINDIADAKIRRERRRKC